MAWWRALIALVSAFLSWNTDGNCARTCAAFDATFIQIHSDQLGHDEAHWRSELDVLRKLGIKLVVVQFTGDRDGAYDRDGRAPVASLLAAASAVDIHVLLGLHDD